MSWEKAKRAPVNDPREVASKPGPPHRLTRSKWREQARRVGEQLPAELENREGTRQAQPPWKERRNNWKAHVQLEGENRTVKEAEKALKLITVHEADVVIYTDGSAAAGTSKGGAEVVVTREDHENPTVLTEMMIKGRELTSSYEEEREAMLSATEWIRNAEVGIRKVLICTDSQSLIQSPNNKSEDTDEIRTNLENSSAKTTIQWVPNHVNIPGNEMADTLANEATISEDPPKPVSLAAARACIKRTIKDGAPSHPRVAAVYSKLSRRKDQARGYQNKKGRDHTGSTEFRSTRSV